MHHCIRCEDLAVEWEEDGKIIVICQGCGRYEIPLQKEGEG